MEEVERACTAANAHSFVSRLPDGYDTQVHNPCEPCRQTDGQIGMMCPCGKSVPSPMLLKAPQWLLNCINSALPFLHSLLSPFIITSSASPFAASLGSDTLLFDAPCTAHSSKPSTWL